MTGFVKLRDVILYKDEQYNTFPNAVVCKDGAIFVCFRQAPDWQTKWGRATHIDPSSKAVSIVSHDGGETWSPSRTMYDDYLLGVQDPCVNRLRDGTLFATYFTWKVLASEDAGDERPNDYKAPGGKVGRLGGAFTIRSTDGGVSWDDPLPVTNGGRCIRGNAVELEDGTLILPTYGGTHTRGQVFIVKSSDRGESWSRMAFLEIEGYLFHEPNLHRTPSGKLVLFLRSRNLNGPEENGLESPLFTCESADGGVTWSKPVKRPFYSPSPFHVLPLQSGKVLVTYGYRFEPFGIRAFFLDAECTAWDNAEEHVLREDAAGVDIGYTSAVQLDNGDILVTYYYCTEEHGPRYIAATLCREPALDSI